MVPVWIIALIEEVSPSDGQMESRVDPIAPIDFKVAYKSTQEETKRNEWNVRIWKPDPVCIHHLPVSLAKKLIFIFSSQSPKESAHGLQSIPLGYKPKAPLALATNARATNSAFLTNETISTFSLVGIMAWYQFFTRLAAITHFTSYFIERFRSEHADPVTTRHHPSYFLNPPDLSAPVRVQTFVWVRQEDFDTRWKWYQLESIRDESLITKWDNLLINKYRNTCEQSYGCVWYPWVSMRFTYFAQYHERNRFCALKSCFETG